MQKPLENDKFIYPFNDSFKLVQVSKHAKLDIYRSVKIP
jgi:hypothetical protein